MSADELYPPLLGPAWASLPSPVRHIHTPTRDAPARGCITVRRGTHPLSRLIGFLLRLPRAGESVDAELRVTAIGTGQRWTRIFGGIPLVTDQAADGGLLLEFAGPFALAFRLAAEGASLTFHQAPTRVGRPGFFLPWPAALSPRVLGRCAGEGPDTAHVDVSITAPLVGLLVAYDGRFTVTDA